MWRGGMVDGDTVLRGDVIVQIRGVGRISRGSSLFTFVFRVVVWGFDTCLDLVDSSSSKA